MARLRGSKWQADAIVDGRRVRPSFDTQDDAEAFERDPKGEQVKPLVGIWFKRAADAIYLGTKNEVGAYLIVDELVRRLGETTRLTAITSARVQDLKSEFMRKGNGKQTVNRKIATLSRVLAFCKDRGLVTDMPILGYYPKENGRIRFLSDEEEQRLIEPMPAEFYHFCKFLLYTGARLGEALDLEWQDCGLGVTFWKTKGNKPRTVPLVGGAKAALEWSRLQGHTKPWAWIDRYRFRYAWNKAKLGAGLKGDDQVVPHVLRHTCASRLVQAGVDIVRVKEWLGHSSVEQTMAYAHLAPHSLFDVAHLLDRVPLCHTDRYPVSVPDGVTCATKAEQVAL